MIKTSKEKNIEEIIFLYRQLFEIKCSPQKVNFEDSYFEDFKSKLEKRSEKFLLEYKKELELEIKLLKIEKLLEKQKEKFVDGIIELYKNLEITRIKCEGTNESVDIENIKSYKEKLMSIKTIELIKYKYHLLYYLSSYKINIGIDNVINLMIKK